MRQFSLFSKLSLVILAAIFIPLILLAVTSFSSANNIANQNLEAFIAESGSRRLEAVEKDIGSALLTLDEFVSRNENTLALIFRNRNEGTVGTRQSVMEGIIEDVFREELIQSTNYFNSVSLVTNAGLDSERIQPFATASTDSALNYNETNSENIRLASENLQVASDINITLVVTQHEDGAHLELLQSVVVEGSTGVLGYLLADLNLESIVYRNLDREEGAFDTYAYLFFPFNNAVIYAPDIGESLIDTSSTGADRVRIDETGSSRYFVVNEDGDRREVMGYSGIVEMSAAKFGVVTEVNKNIVFQQVLSEALTRIFPLVVGGTTILGIFLLIIANQIFVPPINRLRQAVLGVIRGDFDEPVPDRARQDEIGALATSFVDMREYVRSLINDANRQLRERTRDVQVTQDISRAVTAERDVQQLMGRVVQLIVDNFPTIYHAQVFLIDPEHEFAVLRSSTGKAGQALLARGHKLAVGSVSVIGQVTEQGQVVIARDTADSVHRRNEFLQETAAELAIPLRLGNQIIGALDVQSTQADAFDPDQVNALQTLADQVTIAIENARLYAESEQLLQNIEREQTARTHQNWQQHLFEQRQAELRKTSGITTGYDFSNLNRAVYQGGQSVVGDKTERDTIPFAVPIVLRGQVLGTVEYEVPQAEFSHDKVMLAEELVARMTISLENARLFQTSQRTVERERIVNEISAKLTGQTDIDTILQTAIREVGQALRTPQVAIRLKSSKSNGTSNGTASEQSTS